jgi:hypothetical protein
VSTQSDAQEPEAVVHVASDAIGHRVSAGADGLKSRDAFGRRSHLVDLVVLRNARVVDW